MVIIVQKELPFCAFVTENLLAIAYASFSLCRIFSWFNLESVPAVPSTYVPFFSLSRIPVRPLSVSITPFISESSGKGLSPATINIYKSIQNYTYLHYGVLRKTSSCFIASDFAIPRNTLLSFDVTLHRLKFPSSDRYMLSFSWRWNFLSCLIIC